jgi:peptidyl-prolyl cis-trans isomerase C
MHIHPRKRVWVGGSLLIVAASCLVSCQKPDETAAVLVLAEVGDRSITATDMKAEADRRIKARQAVPEKSALLSEMVNHAAMLQRARAAGLEQDPEVRRRLETVLLAELIERELTPRMEAVGVSPEEIKAEYDRELGRYTHPEQARFALLHLEVGEKASEAKRAEQRTRMEEARRKALEQPADTGRTRGVRAFGSLSVEYSDDPLTRYRGGDVGWLQRGQPVRYPTEVIEAGWALPVGTVSEIVEAPDGLYVVLKTDARPSTVTPLESVSGALRQQLLVRKRQEVEEAFRKEILAAAAPRIHTHALASVELPQTDTLVARNGAAQPPAAPGGTPVPHGN